MEIIKKNIVLVVVLAIALLLAVFLLYNVIEKNREMNSLSQTVDQFRSEIEGLNNEKPAPVKENREWIREDTKKLEKVLNDTRSIFGRPYFSATCEFAKTLGLTDQELLVKFRSYWQKEIKGKTPYMVMSSFLKTFETEKIDKALASFRELAQKESRDEINDSNVNEYLLDAFGVLRTMTDIQCKNYLEFTQKRLSTKLDPPPSPVMIDVKRVTLGGVGSVVAQFSFEDFKGKMPSQDEIPMILKNLRIVEDFSLRLLESEVKHLDSIKRSALHGVKDNKNYIRFNYTINIRGEMNNIRAFINSLQNAYKNNHVYIIKSINLECVNDQAAALIIEGEKPAVATVVDPRKAGSVPQELLGTAVLSPGMIKAEIEFDYVAYVGDELK